MHEVVSLQLGNRANYLATHFWNIQESYFTYPTATNPTPDPSPVDHDIHFRPGIGADGSDTYTPRTLIYDFQANFGGLRKLNALYETLRQDEVVKGLWDGTQQTHTVPPVQPIKYQVNLESGVPTPQLTSRDVRYWSDFNRLYYHPRSILSISPQLFSSSLNATESWSNGIELFKDIDREFDILDRDVRPFVEEADSLSAFQIFSSVDDSWGGYASTYVEELREEYGKKGIWVWAIEDARRLERAKQYQKLASSAKSLRSLSQSASAYIRVSTLPSVIADYVQLETESEWSTSALMCAAIESATLPIRLRDTAQVTRPSISSFEDTLNINESHQIWTLTARARGIDSTNNGSKSGPTTSADSKRDQQAADTRIRPATADVGEGEVDIEPSNFDIDFTPHLPTAHATFPSLTTPRSQSNNHIFSQIESHRYPSLSLLPAFNITPSHSANLRRHYDSEPIVSIYNNPLPFPLLDSYPLNLFRAPSWNRQILVDAALSTRSNTKRDVLQLRDLVAGRMGRGLGLIESDEVEGMYDDLTRIGEAYHWGWEGSDDGEGSDDDDD